MQQIQIQKRNQQDSSPQQTPSGSWPNTPWSGQQQFDEGKSGSVLSSPGKTTPTGAENESPSSAGSQGQQSMWSGEVRKQVPPPPGWEKPMWGGGDTGSQGFERQQEAGESNAFSDNMSGSGPGKEFGWGNQTTGDSLGSGESGSWGASAVTTSSGGWGSKERSSGNTWDNTQDLAEATLPSSLAECWQTSSSTAEQKSQEQTAATSRPDSLQWSGPSTWQSGSTSSWGEGGQNTESGESSWPQQGQRSVAAAAGQQQSATQPAAGASGAAPVSRPQSKDEIIAHAVSSKESWGKIPVRQDTPWDIEEPPKPPPVVRSQSQQPQWGVSQPTPSSGASSMWESVKQEPKEPTRSGSRGSSSGSDSLEWNANKDNDLGNWVGPPGDGGSNSGNSWGAGGDESGSSHWGSGGGKMEGGGWGGGGVGGGGGGGGGGRRDGSSSSWADENEGGGWEGGKTETGTWEDPTAAGSGNFEGGGGSSGGTDMDNGTSMWGGAPAGGAGGMQRQPSWSGQMGGPAPGKSNEPSDVSSWNSNVQGKSGGWGDSQQFGGNSTPTGIMQSNWANTSNKMGGSNAPPPMTGGRTSQMMRSQMLQELVRQGFKREDAQGALIANNMNFESARADLLATASGRRPSVDMNKGRQLRGSSLEDEGGMGGRMDMMGGPPPQLPSSMMPPPLGPPGGMQQRMQVPPIGPASVRASGMTVPPPTMPGAGAGIAPTQQQLAMVQQLLAAISQQNPMANTLLQQLPANQQVMLQQIIQIKAMLQKLSTEQQAILRSPNPQQHRQSLEQLQTMMHQLTLQEQQYIVALFQTPQQQVMGKQPPPLPGMAPTMGGPSDLGMGGLSIKDLPGVGGGMDPTHFAKWKQDSDVLSQQHKLHTPPGVDVNFPFFPGAGGQGQGGMSPGGGQQARLDIEEFIPGRPWQGLAKGPADDPNMTPATANARMSMGRIEDDYVANSLGKSTWSAQGSSGGQWSSPDIGGDVWGAGGNIRGVRPPGAAPQNLMGQQLNAPRPQQWQRSMSWAPDAARPPGAPNTMSTNWLAIKNVTPQVDVNVLRVLCNQVGACQVFPVPKAAQLMVHYSNRDDVLRAQKHISGRQLGNVKVIADVVVDPNILQVLDSHFSAGGAGSGAPPGAPGASWGAMPAVGGASVGGAVAGGWGASSGGAPWASPGATGGWSSQDASAMLPGDLLGGH